MIKVGESYVKFVDKTKPTLCFMGPELKLHYTSYALKVNLLVD